MPRVTKSPEQLLNEMLDKVAFADRVIAFAREAGVMPKVPGRKPGTVVKRGRRPRVTNGAATTEPTPAAE